MEFQAKAFKEDYHLHRGLSGSRVFDVKPKQGSPAGDRTVRGLLRHRRLEAGEGSDLRGSLGREPRGSVELPLPLKAPVEVCLEAFFQGSGEVATCGLKFLSLLRQRLMAGIVFGSWLVWFFVHLRPWNLTCQLATASSG